MASWPIVVEARGAGRCGRWLSFGGRRCPRLLSVWTSGTFHSLKEWRKVSWMTIREACWSCSAAEVARWRGRRAVLVETGGGSCWEGGNRHRQDFLHTHTRRHCQLATRFPIPASAKNPLIGYLLGTYLVAAGRPRRKLRRKNWPLAARCPLPIQVPSVRGAAIQAPREVHVRMCGCGGGPEGLSMVQHSFYSCTFPHWVTLSTRVLPSPPLGRSRKGTRCVAHVRE